MTRVALVAHSTRPRGGMVHTLALAEALDELGAGVTVVAMGDPAAGFARPVRAPHVVVPAPVDTGNLEEKVFRSVDTLAAALVDLVDRFDLIHTQDCIAARAAVRAVGGRVPVLRTVHHVDDFTTPALIDCQRQAILEPDRVLVVSRQWQEILRNEYGVEAEVVPNGVDEARFTGAISAVRRRELRARVGADDGRFLFLAVGGIEPRKGSVHLLGALAAVQPSAALAVVGGQSYQDYTAYREAALARLPALGLELGRDVTLLGTVSDGELPDWYAAADALAFPSLKEGWGLAVLEAMASGLPVIATDIPVFREYLTHCENALLVPPADPDALADAMRALMADATLRTRLATAGREVAARYTWDASARRHLSIYQAFTDR